MKRIKFMLLAIAMLLAAPAFLTSCQEDAPEINYTMNVSVSNDFTKVVEAINNGSLKNEQAIAKLTEAIDKMNADQQTKLQAIIDVLNSVNATLESKLALIEAAIKAQTLSLEEKLDLLEQAIKALPDYSDKFDAVVAALNAMKVQIEALGTGQTAIATQIGEVTAAINSLIDEVKNGNTDAAAALAQIIQKLEELKAAIGSGGGSTPSVAVTSVTLNKTMLSLKEGLATTLIATVQPDNATNKNVTWESDNTTVATVDANGKVTARTAGEATITVTTEDGGKTATCVVTVVAGGGGTVGDEYVDLGLPSGLKWAKCNLGASKPSDYGDYYAWGETEPKTKYTWATYKWGTKDNLTKYNATDGKTTLEAADDAATQKLGSPWRMPTYDEIKELLDNCTWTWTTQDGKNGYEVKGTNGNSIFVPAAGCRHGSELSDAGIGGDYWSSSLGAAGGNGALFLYFDSGVHDWYVGSRYFGFTVRPVRP